VSEPSHISLNESVFGTPNLLTKTLNYLQFALVRKEEDLSQFKFFSVETRFAFLQICYQDHKLALQRVQKTSHKALLKAAQCHHKKNLRYAIQLIKNAIL